MSALSNLQDLYNKFQAILPEYQAAQSALVEKFAAIDPASPIAQEQFDTLKIEQNALASSPQRTEYSSLYKQIQQAYSAAAAEDPTTAAQIKASVSATITQNSGLVTNTANTIQASITKEKASPKEPENTLPPAGSAAADVANSADGATQNPAPAATSTGRLTTTEAATLAQNTETGTNPPVKTLTQTQSVPEGRPGGKPGVGAAGEDGASRANTKQILDTVGNKPFQPKNNVLDQYASYTYNIGWYILTPEQYTKLQTSAKPSISQYNLLMQSGGAPAVQPDLIDASGRRNAASDPRSTTYTGPAAAPGRNPFFGLDYYLDNFELTSTILGKGAGRANNVGSLKFTVTEPANITLINNLYKAVKQLYPDTNATYSTAYYALVIRFYGYDETGKIVQASNGDNNNAIVEKIIPFNLSNIEFTVSNKLVEYQVTAVGAPYNIGFGSNLGVIKEKIEVSGATVKDLMTKGSAPPEVSPADGRKTVGELPMKQQAAIAAGTDYNLVNDDGMAFGGGGLTGA